MPDRRIAPRLRRLRQNSSRHGLGHANEDVDGGVDVVDEDVDEDGGGGGGEDEDVDVDEDEDDGVDGDANHANPSIGPVALRRLMPIRDHHLPHLVDRLPH